MVKVEKGVLIQCDIPTKVFIEDLNSKQRQGFIIRRLDDTTLLVKPGSEELIQQELKKFQDENTYQPPKREDKR